jgi:hypothetical protein
MDAVEQKGKVWGMLDKDELISEIRGIKEEVHQVGIDYEEERRRRKEAERRFDELRRIRDEAQCFSRGKIPPRLRKPQLSNMNRALLVALCGLAKEVGIV